MSHGSRRTIAVVGMLFLLAAGGLAALYLRGRRDVTTSSEAAYQAYQADDRRIRALDGAGDLHGAIAFDVGTAAGQSNADFAGYDSALKTLIDINQRAFDTAIRDGNYELDAWTWLIPVVGSLLVVGLVVVGTRPRLAEYR